MDISRLQNQLLVTKLQNRDNPLYQLLYQLIQILGSIQQSVNTISSDPTSQTITNIINNTIISGSDDSGVDSVIIPGPAGVAGSVGPQGPQGPAGPSGPQGQTIVIENDYSENTMVMLGSGNSAPIEPAAAVLAYNSSSQTVTVNVETVIELSTTLYDSDSFWSGSTPNVLTIPTGRGGVYRILGQTKWNLVGTGSFALRLYKNSSDLISECTYSVTDSDSAIQISGEASLDENDTIEMRVLLVTGSASEDTVGGDAETFLSCALTSSVVSSGGGSSTAAGLVLLASTTVNAATTADLTTRNATGQSGALFASDYDEYLLEIVGIQPANNNVGLGIRFTSDGGSTWIATNYAWTHWVYGPAGTGQTANTGQAEIRTIGFVNASNTSTFGINGHVRIFNPLSTSLFKVVQGQISFWDTNPGLVIDNFSGSYSQAATAINGIRLLATSGNVSGTIRVYGLSK
jgi:hypothetical protein